MIGSMRTLTRTALLLLVLMPASAAAAPRAPVAMIEEIPPPTFCSTSEVRGEDISPTGEVVGWSWCNPLAPFRWSGTTAPLAPGIRASGVNGAGQIAATTSTPAAYRDDAQLASPARAMDIDEAGTVVGAAGPDGAAVPVLWRLDGSSTTLPLAPGQATGVANGISSDGNTVGGRSGDLAARWTPALELLEPLSGPTDLEQAQAVNDLGDAVGISRAADGYSHAVLWRAGRAVPARIAPKGKVYMSSAYGIDNRGRVVGNGNSPRAKAFVWTPQRGYVELNTLVSGWNLTGAFAINDRGQITGAGTNPAGLPRAYRLTLPEGF